MIEYCIQKEKKMIVVDTIVPEITSNPETRNYKHNKKKLPLYGIVSLTIALIGIIVVLFNVSNLSISLATPILLISVITAGAGIDADIMRGTAVLGLIVGGIFLVISLSPVIQFISALFIF